MQVQRGPSPETNTFKTKDRCTLRLLTVASDPHALHVVRSSGVSFTNGIKIKALLAHFGVEASNPV